MKQLIILACLLNLMLITPFQGQATQEKSVIIVKEAAHASKEGKGSETAWCSGYMLGKCFASLNHWEGAFECYLNAYQHQPCRAEPLYKIAEHYRIEGEYDLAFFFANKASSISNSSDRENIGPNPIYDYLIDQEISILSFYNLAAKDGFDAANRLMISKNAPAYVRNYAYQNVLYYINPLENATYESIKFNLPRIHEDLLLTFNAMNPTIKKTDDGYIVICRTVNYFQYGGKWFHTIDALDPTNKIITRNFLLKYDCEFNLLSQQEIVENLRRNHFYFMNCFGLEDCRLFLLDGSVWFTCTTLDTNPCKCHQISMCKLECTGTEKQIQVEKLIPLMGPNLARCEKNWLPFIKDNEIYLIYSYDPFVIYKANPDQYFCPINDQSIVVEKTHDYNFTRFCGSAPPIEFDDGYLLLIHEVAYLQTRHYMHRFVYMDKNFNITKLSKPFYYLHKGIEYCCGLTIDHENKNLVMTIGIEDRQAYFCFVDLATVANMLEPI